MIAFSTFTPPKKFSKQYLATTHKSDLRSYAPAVIDITDLPDEEEEEAEGDNNVEEPSTKKRRRITTCESDAPASKAKGGKKGAAGGRGRQKRGVEPEAETQEQLAQDDTNLDDEAEEDNVEAEFI
jgi:hypothetical protein